MTARFRRGARAVDIWPGFVDALATLLLVLIFLLVVFVVAEFFLGRVLSGREDELAGLKNAIAELEDLLSLEEAQTSDLRGDLDAVAAELTTANRDREDLRAERLDLLSQVEALTRRGDDLAAALEESADGDADAEALRLLLAETRAALAAARAEQYDAVVEAAESRSELDEERRLSDAARQRVALLNAQLARLRAQLAAIQSALDASERDASDKDAQIADLGRRLNLALAQRVEELQQARSVFFARLREVLGGRSDVRIDGDRFVIPSGVLFASGSDRLGDDGIRQVADLAALLLEISAELPTDVDWVLRIDGHTDRLPVRETAGFGSNWALSAARAITVVRTLVANGVPPERLMAAGFGEFQPLDGADTAEAYRRNRRIELKLTQR